MMSSLMEYKGYHAKIEYDNDDEIFVGHVLGLTDSLNFHGESIKEFNSSMRDCIDNYLDYCKKIGKEPEKEFKGSFNIRIKPEQHKRIALYAAGLGITINQ
ncbi:MAG: type II toxin-antitoxin system HicB family antitoxin, partial [Lachnospiraceae bacterium]|nr:type II toxin-antitoxin system HicB family antitoxin [Lachnospiraceae bacterium]